LRLPLLAAALLVPALGLAQAQPAPQPPPAMTPVPAPSPAPPPTVVAPPPAHAQPPQADARREAPLSLGARLGGLAAFQTPAGGTPTGVGGGIYGLYDLRSLLSDLSFDLYAGKDAFLFTGGLGAYWAFSPENISPYAGGGAKLAYAKFGGDGAVGMQLFGAVGILASRNWKPNIRLELAWFVDTFGERPKGGGSRRYATGPIATIGLGF